MDIYYRLIVEDEYDHYIKPAPVLKYIQLNVVRTKSGMKFEEIVGKTK